MYHTCSLCPAQGANNFTGYQPTYWQYMDKVVYWAGSASEGIIIPPSRTLYRCRSHEWCKDVGTSFLPAFCIWRYTRMGAPDVNC
ncbi:hypothetical protein NXV73_04940 [Bacteroides salyersiae]|nr:hypothetical protein [Bacteroides salyersiae]